MADSTRRQFLTTAGTSALAALYAVSFIEGYKEPIAEGRPPFAIKKLGHFDIEADGTLSLHGQTKFPIYGANGGLSGKYASYKYKRGNIVEGIETA